jgi:phospholipid/cholesterol/gamma-HCH transport system ATP-binding protein
MLLSSEEPVVRQFLNAQRHGPIGMAEEKDASELEAEAAAGIELPMLPPIPLQMQPTDGRPRAAERTPGEWCRANGVIPPVGSFAPAPGQPTVPAQGGVSEWAGPDRVDPHADTVVIERRDGGA